jgi:hypothetical protein
MFSFGSEPQGARNLSFFFATLPPGAVYQTPPNLTWVWLRTGSLFRACLLYRSWHSEAEPSLFFVPHNAALERRAALWRVRLEALVGHECSLFDNKRNNNTEAEDNGHHNKRERYSQPRKLFR